MFDIINQKIKEIETVENVKVLYAVESGSRAWGFASPDSDYDIRFIYVRKKDFYLQLNDYRDVIEWQLDEVFDINGWDLQKALKLLYKSNPTVFEWCNSNIVYKSENSFEEFKTISNGYFISKYGVYHYLNTAKSNYREYLKTDIVKLKKYFYVLRPILACKWIIEKQSAPPMLFTELVSSQLENHIKPIVEDLLNIKMNSTETNTGKRIDALNDYLETSIEYLNEAVNKMSVSKDHSWDKLNQYFLSVLE